MINTKKLKISNADFQVWCQHTNVRGITIFYSFAMFFHGRLALLRFVVNNVTSEGGKSKYTSIMFNIALFKFSSLLLILRFHMSQSKKKFLFLYFFDTFKTSIFRKFQLLSTCQIGWDDNLWCGIVRSEQVRAAMNISLRCPPVPFHCLFL